MSAGNKDQLVRFERAQMVDEALGGEAPGELQLLEHAYAEVRYGTSAERRESGQLSASQIATFRVLSTAVLRTVTPGDWIRHDPAYDDPDAEDGYYELVAPLWNITGGIPAGPDIEFTAVLKKG